MYPNLSGKTVNLNCSEHVLPDFPDLLFGTSDEIGMFFDATDYIEKSQSNLNIIDFFKYYEAQIKSLCNTYNIEIEDICVVNTQGHVLIESTFVYFFISYVEPIFLAYICERMNDLMFEYGFCVSDTLLYNFAKNRLSNDLLKKIVNETNESN